MAEPVTCTQLALLHVCPPNVLQGVYTWYANVTDQVDRQLACFTMKIKISG